MKKKTWVLLITLSVVFLVSLSVCVFLLRRQANKLFSEYTTNQVYNHSSLYAMIVEERFTREWDELGQLASIIEEDPAKADEIISAAAGSDSADLILDKDESLTAPEVTYKAGAGLSFAYPIPGGGALVRTWPEEEMEARFAVDPHDVRMKVCIVDPEGQVIIPYVNGSADDDAFYNSEMVSSAFEGLLAQAAESGRATQNVIKGDERMILFATRIEGYDYFAEGFLPQNIYNEKAGLANRVRIRGFLVAFSIVFIGLVRLLTMRKKVQENEKKKLAAEQASNAKSHFLANMSHEIRTPINAVLGMDELILRETEEEQTRNYALDIRRAGNSLLSLINDVLDFSKIEAGKMDLVPADYDLALVIADLNDMIRPRMRGKGLDFVIQIDPSLPRFLHGDGSRLKQCILNLLTNAAKYTEKGEVRFAVTVEDKSDSEVGIRVSVKDTGIGIRKEDIDRLFSAFDRIDEERNRDIEGTGLGMNIVQSLLALMDSHLDVSSEYGKGSEFSFFVRQQIVNDIPIGDYEATAREAIEKELDDTDTFTAPDARVLVVDDNELNLTVAKGLLKRTQIKTDTATGAEDAFAKMVSTEYDVLLIDHMMPMVSGIEMLHLLRKQTDNLNCNKPCIILTANAISGAKENYLAEGFDGYLSKPIDSRELERQLIRFLPEEKVNGVKPEAVNEASAPQNTETDADNEVMEFAPAAKGEEKEKAIYTGIFEKIKTIPGIDTRAGLGYCNTMNLYMDVLSILHNSLEDRLGELDMYAEQADYEDYAIVMHSLKGSFKTIGAAKLGDQAQKLEDAGKLEDADYIRTNHDPFMKECRSLSVSLSEAFG